MIGPILAGLCATLLGIGLQRFAYGPLLPAMVQEGWLGAGAAGALGAANFAGYLVGALLAPRIGQWFGLRRSLRAAMVVAASCFLLCAWRGGFGWFVPWRTLAGVAGGVLMVLTGPAVQSVVDPHRRGLAGGVMFTGVGSGIVIGAVIVPLLLPAGLPSVWLMLGVVGLVLAALSWSLFPNPPPARRAAMPRLEGASLRLVASYTLLGVAATPHMGWWPDFIARGLGQGTSSGAGYWLLYGVAAMAGPALCGRMADRIGARRSFMLICAGLLVALALPLLSTGMPVLVVSTILAGGTTIGSTALALTRAREVAGESTPGLWGACTVGWAASQTGASFFLAWLYTATGGHLPLFGAGLVAAAGAAWLMRK